MYKFCPNCGYEVKNSDQDGFKCQQCGKHTFYNSKPAVAIFPVCGGQVLLSIRGEEPFIGMVDPVGGFLNNGEEPTVGAVREFREETGYEINSAELIYIDTVIDEYPFEGEVFYSLSLCYLIRFDHPLKLQPQSDVASLKWYPISQRHDFSFTGFQATVDKIATLLIAS